MRLIEEQYTRTPFYGILRMTVWLRSQGYRVNHKRVERLMPVMEIEAIYPKPNLSRSNREHRIYPYLLGGVEIDRVNLEYRHHIGEIEAGIFVPGGNTGLVLSPCGELAIIKHNGYEFVSGGPG